MIDRRAFVTVVAGSILAGPLAAEAQPARAKLAMLLTGSPAVSAPEYAAFTKQLGDFGWVEGQNLVIDRRWAVAAKTFVALAADAVREKPTVILTTGPYATQAAQEATSTIPIVMIASTDPRVLGVASLAHPGGNLTGLTIGQPEVTSEKRLQLFKEAVPFRGFPARRRERPLCRLASLSLLDAAQAVEAVVVVVTPGRR